MYLTLHSLQGNDAVRLTGVSEAINSQIAKFDSSEFDDGKEAAVTRNVAAAAMPRLNMNVMNRAAAANEKKIGINSYRPQRP